MRCFFSFILLTLPVLFTGRVAFAQIQFKLESPRIATVGDSVFINVSLSGLAEELDSLYGVQFFLRWSGNKASFLTAHAPVGLQADRGLFFIQELAGQNTLDVALTSLPGASNVFANQLSFRFNLRGEGEMAFWIESFVLNDKEGKFLSGLPDTTRLSVQPLPPPLLAAPTLQNALAEDGQVKLIWTSVSSSLFERYRVKFGTEKAALTGRLESQPRLPMDTTITVTGLENDVSYFFTVVAVDTLGREGLPGDTLSATPKTETSIGEDHVLKRATFRLDQNFPNPFNPSTTISFSLDEATDVTLKVYTLAGQEVRTLVQSKKNAGQHMVVFDAGTLATGVYIYQLQVGERRISKKFLLLK